MYCGNKKPVIGTSVQDNINQFSQFIDTLKKQLTVKSGTLQF